MNRKSIVVPAKPAKLSTPELDARILTALAELAARDCFDGNVPEHFAFVSVSDVFAVIVRNAPAELVSRIGSRLRWLAHDRKIAVTDEGVSRRRYQSSNAVAIRSAMIDGLAGANFAAALDNGDDLEDPFGAYLENVEDTADDHGYSTDAKEQAIEHYKTLLAEHREAESKTADGRIGSVIDDVESMLDDYASGSNPADAKRLSDALSQLALASFRRCEAIKARIGGHVEDALRSEEMSEDAIGLARRMIGGGHE